MEIRIEKKCEHTGPEAGEQLAMLYYMFVYVEKMLYHTMIQNGIVQYAILKGKTI